MKSEQHETSLRKAKISWKTGEGVVHCVSFYRSVLLCTFISGALLPLFMFWLVMDTKGRFTGSLHVAKYSLVFDCGHGGYMNLSELLFDLF